MGRPAKIHKKKSFMFTTKHTSFCGMLGAVIAVCTLTIIITMVIYSYEVNGDVSLKFGGIAFSTVLLNIIGIISGIVGVNERDVYITPPIIGMAGNGILIAAWIVLIFFAYR